MSRAVPQLTKCATTDFMWGSMQSRAAEPRGIIETKLGVASAGLGGRNVAGSDFVLVGGEGCQDFGLLALWDLGEIQAPSELVRSQVVFLDLVAKALDDDLLGFGHIAAAAAFTAL